MMKMLYSINSLAMLLERDRGTVTRALRGVAPDAKERGQPRWKISTAIEALNARSIRANSRGNCLPDDAKAIDLFAVDDPELYRMRADYEQQVRTITVERTARGRRRLALALAPLIENYQRAFLEAARARAPAADAEAIGFQGDAIFSEMMDEVAKAAQWDHRDEYWEQMFAVMPSASEYDD